MKILAKIAVLAGATMALAGCSEGTKGWNDGVQSKAPTFSDELELRDVTLSDGRQIECLVYSDGGHHRSSFALDCNWNPR